MIAVGKVNVPKLTNFVDIDCFVFVGPVDLEVLVIWLLDGAAYGFYAVVLHGGRRGYVTVV